jgi:dTDP-4-dehydrorhamnose 3,5-epimerase
MKILKTKIKDLLIIEKQTYKDNRGFLRELYKENTLSEKFKFQILSKSKKNVVRGLHIQQKKQQGKYVTILNGKVFDVAVDLRKNSKTFGQHFSLILSGKENISFYIPPGFAHGFCSLEENTIVHYMCTNYRDKDSEIGIIWNDPALNIKWPIKRPIISTKDTKNISFKEYKGKFLD